MMRKLISISGPKTRQSIVTRSKKVVEESEKVTTLAVLKTVKTSKLLAQAKQESVPEPGVPPPPAAADDSKEKENKVRSKPAAPPSPSPPPPAGGATSPAAARERFNIFSPRRPPPCVQYKTDKGYKCPNCQRCYNARRNLVRHVTLECGIEPQYKCPYCTCRKHRRNELKKHIEKKHPEHAGDASPTPAAPLAVK